VGRKRGGERNVQFCPRGLTQLNLIVMFSGYEVSLGEARRSKKKRKGGGGQWERKKGGESLPEKGKGAESICRKPEGKSSKCVIIS